MQPTLVRFLASQVSTPSAIPNRSSKLHRPICPLSPHIQFPNILANFLRDTLLPSQSSTPTVTGSPGVKQTAPYWRIRTTYAKERWFGKSLIDVLSEEFRARSRMYYKYAIQSGLITLNSQIVSPDRIVGPSDRLEHVVHFHEPPITSTPIKILHSNPDFLIVDKPAGMPVHPTGLYLRNTLIHILKHTHQFTTAITINRLDRLVSGLLVIPLNPSLAWRLGKELENGGMKKEYVARVWGAFPSSDSGNGIVCEQPLLTIDKQVGKNVVHPDGKPAKTIFTLIRYDVQSNTSIVHCQPITGRMHQIRVHLQWMGYPIVYDRVYSRDMEVVVRETMSLDNVSDAQVEPQIEDITKHDYTYFQSLISYAKSLLPSLRPLPATARTQYQSSPCPLHTPSQLEIESSLTQLSLSHSHSHLYSQGHTHTYCSACYLPMHPTLTPEELYICLHAWRYSTSLGCFQSEMPRWVKDGWTSRG